MSDDHDRIGGLDQLWAPEVDEEFWEVLRVRLNAEARVSAASATMVPIVGRTRPRRRIWAVAMTAAAAVLVAVLGVAVVGSNRPGRPTAPPTTLVITDPRAIDLDRLIELPASGSAGRFVVFDLDRLPTGWRISRSADGVHSINDAEPTHYGWNAEVTTDDGRMLFLTASLSYDDPTVPEGATPVTVHGLDGHAVDGYVRWHDAAGVQFFVSSPSGTPDELTQLANRLSVTTIDQLPSTDRAMADPTPSGQVRLGGTIAGTRWQVASVVNGKSGVSGLALVSGAGSSSFGVGTPKTLTTTYTRVLTGVGQYGYFVYGAAPGNVTSVRVRLALADVDLPVGSDGDGNAVFAIPIPAGVTANAVEFLDTDGTVVHRDDLPAILIPSGGTTSQLDRRFDPPSGTPVTTERTETS